MDGDGYDTTQDCDDTAAAVNPATTETWYDGWDQDCAGGSDYDSDGDGHDAVDYGGLDCDDQDPSMVKDCPEPEVDTGVPSADTGVTAGPVAGEPVQTTGACGGCSSALPASAVWLLTLLPLALRRRVD